MRSALARRGPFVAVVMALGAMLCGCGLQVPTDPGGSLDRITGDVLRAGASPDSDWVIVEGDDVSGRLVMLVEDFARMHDAEVEWVVGSEESLVRDLEEGRLHVAVGGMTADSPWMDRAGLTRSYPSDGRDGGREFVMFVPLGENRLLAALERHLDEELLP